ncbi:MAG: hypothetical protein QOE61_4336 [Micromonosporaceae bacterium]|jgi:hypothetical protein|nr:hypothetical protein [Micromonosporaceae bacterium]
MRQNSLVPSFLAPDAVDFSWQDQLPLLRLAVDQPEPAIGATGWSVLIRATMCVVDGPGDAGFLVARLGPGGDLAPEAWGDAVDRAGGCLVGFGEGQATFVPSAG